MPDSNKEMIICNDVHKWFGEFHVLRGVTTIVQEGEVVVIIGPSGSGKSTWIRTINRLEEHQRGQIIVDGTELNNDIRNIQEIRREVGMVFQQFNLFPHLTALENVSLAPIHVRKWSHDRAEEIAMQQLERVKIPEQAHKYPGQLSGGQQQRVAIARALINRPTLLLADEPTGNLDSANSEEVLNILAEFNAQGQTILMVTHDPTVAAKAKCILFIHDGRLVERMSGGQAGVIAQRLAELR
jgi:general L-amino acid transport system ATP-binding protein